MAGMRYIYLNKARTAKNINPPMPKKVKARLERVEISDLPTHVDAEAEISRILNEEFAKSIDQEILEGLFQMTFDENVALLERMYPGQNPYDALRRLGLDGIDLRREVLLAEKVRAARIDSISE